MSPITDSTSHILKRLAKAYYPSTSRKRPAGVKLHTVISLRDTLPLETEVTPQRMHDNKAFAEWTLEPGTLSLFDLGYMDVGRLVDAANAGAGFLTRMKMNQNPEIVRVHRGISTRAAKGLGVGDALMEDVLAPKKGVLDLDVRLTSGKKSAIVRCVCLEEEEGERHWYLTTIDRDVLSAHDIGETYRIRWAVELLFKQMKSGLGLDAILAWKPSAVMALLYAKVVSLCLVRLLELAVEERYGRYATTQLALTLTLSRCTPLLLSYFMQQQGLTLEVFEERLLTIARMVAKSRNQRRERAKRKRAQALGSAP